MIVIVHDEPGTDGKNIEIRRTCEEAIRVAEGVAAVRDYLYDSKEDALADYMTIHWAREEETGHELLELANQYCKHCGEAMYTRAALRPCKGAKIKATPEHEQCTGCDDMAECIEAVAFLGDDAVCIRTKSILDAKDINYSRSKKEIAIITIECICIGIVLCAVIYGIYSLFTFEGSIF